MAGHNFGSIAEPCRWTFTQGCSSASGYVGGRGPTSESPALSISSLSGGGKNADFGVSGGWLEVQVRKGEKEMLGGCDRKLEAGKNGKSVRQSSRERAIQ